MSSLHQGFQETGQAGDSEAIFRWLDGADESPLIQQVKQRMLESGLEPEGFAAPLRKLGTDAALYREANVTLLAEEWTYRFLAAARAWAETEAAMLGREVRPR